MMVRADDEGPFPIDQHCIVIVVKLTAAPMAALLRAGKQ
jgi:hypothetical protein